MDTHEILNELMGQVQQVKDGNKNALDVYPQLNALKKSIDELRKEIQDEVIEEASKYSDREDIIRGGYRISVVNNRKYSYDHNPRYQLLDQKRKNLQALMKKAASSKGELFDEDTGEVIPPAEVTHYTYPKCEWVGREVQNEV